MAAMIPPPEPAGSAVLLYRPSPLSASHVALQVFDQQSLVAENSVDQIADGYQTDQRSFFDNRQMANAFAGHQGKPLLGRCPRIDGDHFSGHYLFDPRFARGLVGENDLAGIIAFGKHSPHFPVLHHQHRTDPVARHFPHCLNDEIIRTDRPDFATLTLQDLPNIVHPLTPVYWTVMPGSIAAAPEPEKPRFRWRHCNHGKARRACLYSRHLFPATEGPIVNQPSAPEAQDFMTRKVHTVTPEMSLAEAIQFLKRHKVSNAPVVENDSEGHRVLIGFLSEGDCLEYLSNEAFFGSPA